MQDAESYNVYRSADNADFLLIASEIQETSYTDKTPLNGANYYRVTAVIDNVESQASQSCATTFVKNGLHSGIYLGICGFDKVLNIDPIEYLSDANISEYHAFINSLTATQPFTSLYYAVDKSIDHLQATNLPSDLYNVAIVTFTDGLDVSSLDEKDKEEMGKYLTFAQYRDALQKRLTTELVSGVNISAYTIGIINDRGSSLATFRKNMNSLATSPSYVYEVSDINNLNQIFEEIANSLSETKYVQRFVMSISGQSHNEKCRFTFDNIADLSSSKMYIEGTYDRLSKSLIDVTYHGLSSTSGSTVQGIYNETTGKYDFVFEGLQSEDGSLIPTDNVKHWYTDEGVWQDVDDEYYFSPDDASVEKIKRSAAIMLNLDCSSSMKGEKIQKLQEAANSFVQTLADNSTDPTEVSSISLNQTTLTLTPGLTERLEVIVLPETAKLKTVDWSSSNSAVATVDENGIVTAIADGQAVISAVTRDGGLTASCVVNVLTVPTPQNLSGKIEGSTVVLTWDPIEDANYDIYREQEDGNFSKLGSSTSCSYVDETPLVGTNKYYVIAVVGKYSGGSSESVAITYTPVPQDLTISFVTNSVKLNWTAITGAFYTIARSFDNIHWNDLASGIETNSYIDTEIPSGSIFYKVKARIDDTESEYCEVVRVNYLPVPEILSCEMSDRQINLSWSDIAGCTYNLYRSGNDGTYILLASALTGTTYTDSNPLPGMNYYRLKVLVDDLESSNGPQNSAMFPYINNYEFVDLGLPSGLKWATMNVGANKPSDYGNYYAWGETSTKTEYAYHNSVTWGEESLFDISADPKYDVATAKWGSSWRIPSTTNFDELFHKCTWTWTKMDGQYGYQVTGPNGNSIFLPASGYIEGTTKYDCDIGGSYWSCNHYNKNQSKFLQFRSSFKGIAEYKRYFGLTVRPVSE